jgi:hypothetical protein
LKAPIALEPKLTTRAYAGMCEVKQQRGERLQAEEVVAPVEAVVEPSGQNSQAVEPREEKVPLKQGAQGGRALGENVPSRHVA